ncbi:Putative acyl carrier protein [Desulfonema limicola]|uniref:Acyl carrier protein n=1 Tax=Desulfonema limicola TaxID=45656 RepID=A0A975B5C6_9BACT|nr:acyl carrier protein [Desulfonema limicola]QTA79103.1 Putative acyl carrier protein [Desulfonema limicola]
MSVIEIVKNFLVQKDYINANDEIGIEDSLLERGIIDSVGIMNLVEMLEQEYKIKIDDDDLMPENFDSLAAIDSYVKSKTN